ncbi:hypothetical protein Ocin01_06816 [Orchesella cincta]|uniref:EGF-like domain-containing protein n=1 Tax=Orchesella cincta TaxID=48709 RepID=A0A1D2N3L0_ORCCI|nr:hypothetical protein Ocin01_06816 [Orchesella cincta]
MSKTAGDYWKTRLSLTLLLSMLLLQLSTVESRVAGQYDDFCSDNSDCSSSQGFLCHNRRCKCAPGGETVFSISRNRCVGAAGRECLRSGNETLCADNSICRDYNYMFLCSCKESYYQSKNGNCYKIAKYGESCREEDYSCGDPVTTSVSCIDRKCRCLLGEENQYYDQSEGKCYSHAGAACLFHYQNPCSNNSYCGEIAENINGASFVVGHRCLCKHGYSYSKNRQCYVSHGNSCSGENSCNYDHFLGCVNGICQCRNPLNEVYDEKTDECTLLVGSRCSMDVESGPKCVKNAECLPSRHPSAGASNSSSVDGICQCGAGYSVTPMNTCLLDLNQRCQPGVKLCNYFNALTCINETCSCVDSSLSYDKATKACVAMISKPCGHVQVYDQTNSGDDAKEIVVLCEGNAICAKIHAQSPASGNGVNAKRVCRNPGSSKNSGVN